MKVIHAQKFNILYNTTKDYKSVALPI